MYIYRHVCACICKGIHTCVCIRACVCICVCVRERARARAGEKEKEREQSSLFVTHTSDVQTCTECTSIPQMPKHTSISQNIHLFRKYTAIPQICFLRIYICSKMQYILLNTCIFCKIDVYSWKTFAVCKYGSNPLRRYELHDAKFFSKFASKLTRLS